MSGTVMKFGPQWIRTLTDGAAPTSAPTTTSTPNTSTTNSTSNQPNNDNSNNNPLYNNSNNNSAAQSTNNGSNSSGSYSSTTSSSNNNNNNSTNNSGAGKYKLAEYRYGREEMLALYEQGVEAPEDIKMFTELFVEKARMPMAMTQMTEDEVKLVTRSWNSDAVLKSSGRLAAAAAAAGGPGAAGTGLSAGGGPGSNHVGGVIPSGINSTMSDRDSRQLSERGAMTAAEVLSSSPRGPPGSLSRGGPPGSLLSSLSSRGHPSTLTRSLVSRNQGLYMRTQAHDDEGIGGDGVSAGGAQVAGSGGPGSGAGGAFENRFGLVNQTRQPNSLRARFETNRPPGSVTTGLSPGTKPIDIKSRIDGENSSERRSVFDRSPSKYNPDDKLTRKDVNGRPLQSDWRSREWSAGGQDAARGIQKGSGIQTEERPWRAARAGGAGTAEDWRSGNNSNSNPASSSWYVKSDDPRNPRAPQNQENLNPSFGGKRDTLRRPSADDKHGDEDDETIGIQPRHRRDSLPEWSIGDPLSGDKVGSFDASGAFREISRDDGGNLLNNIKVKAPEKQSHQHHQQQQHQQQMNQSKRQLDQQNEQQLQGHDFDHLERAAEIMVEKWTEEEEQLHDRRSSPDYLGNKSNQLNARKQHDAQQASMLQNNAIDNRKSNQVHQRQESHQSGQEPHASVGGGIIASQAFDSTNNPQKFILLPANHEDSQQWFYRDTQGVIQGPFSANDMYEWYKAGYFVKELPVRRACDELFYPLGEIIKMWDRIPFAPMPVNLPNPPPITTQTILQFRAVTKQLEMQGRIPQTAYDVGHPGAVLLHGPMLQQQQQQIHPVLATASLNQNALAPPDQQANIRQIIEAATRQQQQQQQQQQHDSNIVQQQRNMPVNVPDQNEMQAQLRQLLAQLKNREGFSNLNAQEQQEVLVRQFVASRSMPQSSVATSNGGVIQDQQEQQAILQQRARMMPFLPAFLSNDQQERMRYQQEIERRQKEELEKQQQQSRLIMEQRMKAEEEKQRLMEEVQKQRQKKQNEENEKQKQEAEQERIMKLSQLKQQQLAKQHEEFKQQMQNQQMQNQQRLQQQQQQEKKQQEQQQDQHQKMKISQLEQIERAKKAAQAHQLQQEQQQQQRKTAWSTVSKPDQEPVSLATLQKLQEEEKERERERQRQQQQQQQQQQAQTNQQQQLQNFQRQMTWASAAQQSKAAPIKTLAEIQKEEEERLAREKQRKAKAQPVVASSGVWNNAATHLSWKNPPSD